MPSFDLDIPGSKVIAAADSQSVDALQHLLVQCSDFFELVEHAPVTADAATNLLSDRPAGLEAARKCVVGFWAGEEMIAAVDLLRNYPTDGDWFVGLMLVSPMRRGQGLGRRLFAAIEADARRSGAKSLHLIVQRQNPAAQRFWSALGFERGEVLSQTVGSYTNQVARMHKRLMPAG